MGKSTAEVAGQSNGWKGEVYRRDQHVEQKKSFASTVGRVLFRRESAPPRSIGIATTATSTSSAVCRIQPEHQRIDMRNRISLDKSPTDVPEPEDEDEAPPQLPQRTSKSYQFASQASEPPQPVHHRQSSASEPQPRPCQSSASEPQPHPLRVQNPTPNKRSISGAEASKKMKEGMLNFRARRGFKDSSSSQTAQTTSSANLSLDTCMSDELSFGNRVARPKGPRPLPVTWKE